MAQFVWLAGMLFANLWGMGDPGRLSNTEKGMLGGAAVGAGAGALIGQGHPAATAIAKIETPILPPLGAGERPSCDNPPSRAEIMRALPRFDHMENVEFKIEKRVDRIDAPRFFPEIGPAQLHHCHWKCTVYFTETIQSLTPLPFRVQKRRVEVVYIDKDHLHFCADEKNGAAEPRANTESCPGGHAGPRSFALRAKQPNGSESRGPASATRGKISPAQTAVTQPAADIKRAHFEEPAPRIRTSAALTQMTIDDVLRLSKAGAADDIIIRQMEITKTAFRPTTDEIIDLVQQGVSARVIRVIQEGGAAPKSTQSQPTRPML